MCAASGYHAADLTGILEEPPQQGLDLSGMRARWDPPTPCRPTDAVFQRTGCVSRCPERSKSPEKGNRAHPETFLRHPSAGSRSQPSADSGVSGSYLAQDHGRLHASDGGFAATGAQDHRQTDGGSVRQDHAGRYFSDPWSSLPREVWRKDAAIAQKGDDCH